MKKNMTPIDRWIRFLLAATAVVLYFTHTVTGTPGLILVAIAAVFLLTSFIGTCPLYSIFGIGAGKSKRK